MPDSVENTPNSTRKEPWSVRRTVNQALKDRDLPDLDEEEELTEIEAEEIETGAQVDVFDHCHQLAEKGEVVSYTINKNSSFLAKKPHPYSWEKLQQEFGEGHYRVIAKSELTKRILKQQTNFVAAAQEREQKESVAETVRSMIPPKADAFEEMSKMATLLKSLQPPPAPVAQDNMTPILLKMMEMQTASQEKSTAMMLEMQKSNREMIEKMDQNQKAAIEKLEAKLAGGGDKKDKGLSAIELLNLVQTAESRGMKNYMMLEEMAERKAAKMGGNGGGDDKEETMMEKLIKTSLPLIASAASQPRAAAVPSQAPRMVTRQVAPARRPAPQAPAAAPKPAQVVPLANAGATVAPAPAATPVKVAEVLPAAPGTAPAQPRASGPTPRAANVPGKQQLLDAIMPVLGQRLVESSLLAEDRVKIREVQARAANETKGIVNRMGMPVTHLLQSVNENDMIEIAKGVGLPDEAHLWLKEYYAHLSAISQTELRNANANSNARKPQA